MTRHLTSDELWVPPQQLSPEAKAHLQTCPECTQARANNQDAINLSNQIPVPIPPPGLVSATTNAAARIAAARAATRDSIIYLLATLAASIVITVLLHPSVIVAAMPMAIEFLLPLLSKTFVFALWAGLGVAITVILTSIDNSWLTQGGV